MWTSDAIRGALSYISAEDHHTWSRVGFALQDWNENEGLRLFDEWSQHTSNYNAKAVQTLWQKARSGKGVSVGTLIYMAKEAGWTPEKGDRETFSLEKALPSLAMKLERERTHENEARERREKMQKVLNACTNDARDRLLPTYLKSRGLQPSLVAHLPDTLATFNHPFTKGPAIVSLMRDHKGEITALHAIPLKNNGERNHRHQKRMYGFVAGSAIWLAPFEAVEVAEEYWLVEGLETGLAVQNWLRTTQRKAVVGAMGIASNLQNFQPPPHAKAVHIAADRDENEAGQNAAFRAGQGFVCDTFVHIPPFKPRKGSKSVDWLDVHNKDPKKVRKHLRKTGTKVEKATDQSNQRYAPLPELREGVKLLCLHWSLGAGKTHYFCEQARKNESVLMLNPRIALSRDLSQRSGLLNYQDVEERPIDEERLVCCINSVGHLLPEAYDLVVIDEAEQTLPVVYGNDAINANESGAMFCELQRQLSTAGLVILADAFLSPETVESVKNMMGLTDEQIQVSTHNYVDKEQKFAFHTSKESLQNHLKKRLMTGKTVAIACTSRADVVALERWMTEEHLVLPEDLLSIHAESDQDAKDTLKDVNRHWQNYRVVLFSPAVSSGVSFDLEHFDDVLLFATSIPGIGWNDLFQQIARVRNPRNKTIHCWIQNRENKANTKRSVIKKEALASRDFARIVWMRHSRNADGEAERHPLNQQHFDCWLELEVVKRRRNHNVQESFVRHLQRNGVELWREDDLCEVQRKETRTNMLRIKQDQKEEAAKAILNAKDINLTEAEAIATNPHTTQNERYSAIKAREKDFFGEDKLSYSVLHRSLGKGGGLKRQITNLAGMKLYGEGFEGYFAEKDREDFETGFDLHVKQRAARYHLLYRMLKVISMTMHTELRPALSLMRIQKKGEEIKLQRLPTFGQDGDTLNYVKAGYVIDVPKETIQGLQDILDEPGATALLRSNGISIRTDGGWSALIGNILRAVGIERENHRFRIKEDSEGQEASGKSKLRRGYRIDIPALEELLNLAEVHHLRTRRAASKWRKEVQEMEGRRRAVTSSAIRGLQACEALRQLALNLVETQYVESVPQVAVDHKGIYH